MIQSTLSLADLPMPEFAPFVTMAFLGTGFLLFACAVGAAIALAFRRRRIAAWIGAGAALASLGYAALVVGAAFLSRDRTLARGEKKYFCESDCHLAYSVVEAARAKFLGQPPYQAGASGVFLVATVKTWFDENTIAPWRGDAPLAPNPRVVFVVDTAGRRYLPSPAGQRAWEAGHGPTTALTKALRPGESYTTSLVFDLPEDISNPRLFLGDPPGIERILIGHENSPGHGKIYFALDAKTS